MYLSQEGVSSQESSGFQKRAAAAKVSVKSIQEGMQTRRVNLAGIVVIKEESANFQSMFIDDGTGKIMVRNFYNLPSFAEFSVGDFVAAIGNCREFSNERYIAAEVVRKIDPAWIRVRQAELEINFSKPDQCLKVNSGLDVLSAVKDLDDGKGAPLSKILEMSSNEDIKLKIDFLLKKGEIFEISPGRLKVLE